MNALPTDPVTIRLTYEWAFDPADSLPEDFDEWSREQVVDWFKDDIAENLSEYAQLGRIRQHLTEVTEERRPKMFEALEALVACLDNGSVIINPEDRRATEDDYAFARAEIAQAKG
jgi:hypothetical protein